jgi:hypothetical protein
MKEAKQMFDRNKMAAQIATLHLLDRSVSPEQMKRYMYSVLKNAVDQKSVACTKGMSHTITLLMATIYGFEEMDLHESHINDAHWEIIGMRPVSGREIGAFCLTALNYCDGILDSNLPYKKDYAIGMMISITALAEIMSIELLSGGQNNEG